MFILVLTRKCVWFLFNSGIAENGAVTETTDIGEKMRRRFILIFLAGILFLSGMDPVFAAGSFDFSHVIEEAEEISRRPYRDETLHLPEDLAHLTPAQYSDIRFRREQGIWYRQDFPFEMQFYHPGGLFNHSVTIYEISDGKVREIPYKFEEFDFGRNQIDTGRETADFGYAGFRLHYPLNREDYYDELISFWEPVISEQWPKARITGCRRGDWQLIRRKADRRNFRFLRSSGSSGRQKMPTVSAFMPCWTVKAFPALTPLRSVRKRTKRWSGLMRFFSAERYCQAGHCALDFNVFIRRKHQVGF